MENIKYTGSCHCGNVKYEVLAPRLLKVIDCNCTICTKKQNRHVIVPSSQFKLLQGHDSLTTYTFNTNAAKHSFCSRCGVQSFYTPRSNPDGIGIMPHTLDGPLPLNIQMETFDGQRWEETMKMKSQDIGNRSKVQGNQQ